MLSRKHNKKQETINKKRKFPVSSFQFPAKHGQSLVEVVVALGVVVVLAIALVGASLVTQRTSRSAAATGQATKLVQQNIEQIRVFRDRRGFAAIGDGNCFTLVASDPDPASWQFSTAVCPDGEKITLGSVDFRRKIAISTSGANRKLVTVTVTWSDSAGSQKVENSTYLASWCPGQIVPGSPCP